MLRFFSCVVICIITLWNVYSFAITDELYNDLKDKYPEFSNADRKLGIIWKAVIDNLNDEEKSQLRKEQREWIKNGWDNEASRIASENSLSEVESYIKACESRINYLKKYIKDNYTSNKNSSVKSDIGIYDFYLGENINTVIQKCIDKKYYVTLFTNSDNIAAKFHNYINIDTQLILNHDLKVTIDKVEGKYINLTNKNTKVVVKNTDNYVAYGTRPAKDLASYITSFIDLIPNDKNPYGDKPKEGQIVYKPRVAVVPSIAYLNECKRNGLTDDECYNKIYREYEQQKEEFNKTYVPLREKLLKSFKINCSLEDIEKCCSASEFTDNVFSNPNNNYDIKLITVIINDQILNLFFMNSPGINIENKLFFICLNATEVSDNKNIKSQINNVFLHKYGKPNVLSNDASYYFINNDLIFHNELQQNSYYFIDPSILTYYITSVNMLYNKFKQHEGESYTKGM